MMNQATMQEGTDKKTNKKNWPAYCTTSNLIKFHILQHPGTATTCNCVTCNVEYCEEIQQNKNY